MTGVLVSRREHNKLSLCKINCMMGANPIPNFEMEGKKMFRKLFNMWIRYKTKNFTRIPLFTMVFDYRKYKQDGKPGSCTFYAHPDIAQDEFVKEKLGEVVDHIRDNYDLDIFTRV
jgi:hypothetical protein